MLTVVIFLLVLTVVVLVHEAGHFFVARWSGMKVYEFGWGFPPRALGFYKDPKTGKFFWVKKANQSNLAEVAGGTETTEEYPATLYSLNWLPLGGFVKIKGENDASAGPDTFSAQSQPKKLATLLAGVVMNFLLAAVLLSFGLTVGLPSNVSSELDNKAIIVTPAQVMVQGVEKDSAAAKAGLKSGDIIASINQEKILSSEAMVAYVKAHNTSSLVLAIVRDHQNQTISLTPAPVESGAEPRLGVSLADAGVVRYPWYWAIVKGFESAVIGFVSIFVSFYTMIKGLIAGTGAGMSVSGPVGIAVAVGESARLGWTYLLNITAMLSLSLAAMNVLPIPALDGGRALFVIIESIFKKRVPAKVEQIVHAVGFIAMLGLIAIITWRDIANLL